MIGRKTFIKFSLDVTRQWADKYTLGYLNTLLHFIQNCICRVPFHCQLFWLKAL